MFDHKQLKKSISCLACALLFCAAAYSQQESRHRVAQPDIISDNLEKAAASADQILEVVNKEAGLMVEFKRLLAQDAGASGQILEESDLTDGAVADRLRSDLRARVLATRLLQRYGYLVPRLNPDSEVAAEQKLVRQERAQMLVDRSLPPSFPESRESLPVNPTAPAPAQAPRSSVPLQRAEDASPSQMTHPDGTGLSPDQRSGYPASLAGPETMLAAAQVDTNPSLSGTPHITGYRSGQNPSLPSSSPGDLQSLSQLDQLSSGAGMPRTGPGSPQYPAGRDSAPAGTAGAEQVRMVRRPNPYADVPSLYDLYVQAGASNRPLERFGLDVFRKGTTNPDSILSGRWLLKFR
jgi:hypothetical protein